MVCVSYVTIGIYASGINLCLMYIFFISYILSSEVVLLKWDWDVVDL